MAMATDACWEIHFSVELCNVVANHVLVLNHEFLCHDIHLQ